MKSNDSIDVIVVGGGIAGLAAATFSARKGLRVHLLEQAHEIGGRARTKLQNGFYLNIGPHALYRGAEGIAVLRELGVEVHGKTPPVSGAFAVRDGVKHTFPVGLASLLTTSLFGLAAKLEVARLLATLPKIDGSALMNVSLSEWLAQNISHAEVRDFLLSAFRVATYTNAPDLMSAGTAIEQLKKAFESNVLYLDHGWQTIVDGLVKSASDAGVVVETGAKVDLVERSPSGAVVGVRRSDGSVLNGRTVVIAASPAAAAMLVENGEPTALGRWADESIPVRAACLDVALECLPNAKPTAAFGIDRPLYFSVHSAAAKLAPEGSALIHVARYLSPDDVDNDAAQQELESFLDLLQPGWREVIVGRRFLPDMIVVNALPLASHGGVSGRPGPDVPEIPGLFVVGDWVGKEGMLADASLASAKRAAELIGVSVPPAPISSLAAAL
jgi:phytoene dehydrogenase-like protein